MQARTLVPAAAAVTATAVVGGLASRPAASSWYQSLRKPSYQPPQQAFPIVWPALYADIAVVSANTLDEMERTGQQLERRRYVAALAGNLVLNASWSWLFFDRRLLGTSAVAAAVLTASSADLARRAVNVQGTRAAPLLLYPSVVRVRDDVVQPCLVSQSSLKGMFSLMKLTKIAEQIIESAVAVVGIRVGTEEPKYTRRQLTDTVELRSYGPRIAAETTVIDDEDRARNIGFRRLAGYIFGANQRDQTISMTAPVSQTRRPTDRDDGTGRPDRRPGSWLCHPVLHAVEVDPGDPTHAQR